MPGLVLPAPPVVVWPEQAAAGDTLRVSPPLLTLSRDSLHNISIALALAVIRELTGTV